MFQTDEMIWWFWSQNSKIFYWRIIWRRLPFSATHFQECCLLGKSPSHGGLRAFSRDAELEAAASPWSAVSSQIWGEVEKHNLQKKNRSALCSSGLDVFELPTKNQNLELPLVQEVGSQKPFTCWPIGRHGQTFQDGYHLRCHLDSFCLVQLLMLLKCHCAPHRAQSFFKEAAPWFDEVSLQQ